jgi:hypothetical protein
VQREIDVVGMCVWGVGRHVFGVCSIRKRL